MAKTASTMLDLGVQAPNFKLINAVDGKTYSLSDFGDAKAMLVMFICNHCPFVAHVMSQFRQLDRDYTSKGLQILAINSNSTETHPQDGPDNMKALAKKEGWSFPFLFDENQETAKAYRAACTPDFFLFDGQRKLFYRGQLDDSRPGNDFPVNGKDLRQAIEAALKGNSAPETQKPSIGCNIKWRPGNEPDYFG